MCKETKKRHARKARKGMTLVELLGVMVVIAILSVIAIGGISAARDNANITSVISDMRTYENSLKQVLMLHPEIMKFVPNKPANAVETVIGYINDQMEEEWAFQLIGGGQAEGGGTVTTNTGSGAVATSTIKRDAWGNSYCLYIYFDDKTTTYRGKCDDVTTGTNLVESDSCVYMVIASPGKNSTGMGLGVDGNNFDATTKRLVDPTKCVNNTDGVDDLGLIIRVLNGDVYSATFGTDKSLLGKMQGIQWVFGVPDQNGGIIHDFNDSNTSSTMVPTQGGSIDQFYDHSVIDSFGKNNLTWIGGGTPYTANTAPGA